MIIIQKPVFYSKLLSKLRLYLLSFMYSSANCFEYRELLEYIFCFVKIP